MSRELIQALHEVRAFKPAPSLWELAATHVPFAELDVDDPPEPRIERGLAEGDGIVVLHGECGTGKSSVLAHVTSRLSERATDADPPKRYLPIFVPVAGQAAATRLDDFGRAAILEVLLAIKHSAPEEARERLETALGHEVVRQRSGAKFNAKLSAKVFNAGPEMGVDLAGDVVSVLGEHRLDNRGGIKTLGDIVRVRGFELLIGIEDTDAWARSRDGDATARTFFANVVRPLASECDVGVVVAVQSHWARLDEVRDLRERAVSVGTMPEAATPGHAELMIERILDRRIGFGLGDRHVSDATARAVFTDDAVAMLANELFESKNVRAPLALVRDTFDRHADDPPSRFERQHLLDSF